MKKTPLSEIFQALEKQACSYDKQTLILAKNIIDNNHQSKEAKQQVINKINEMGFKDYAHFLDLLDNNFFEVALSHEYEKKIFSDKTPCDCFECAGIPF
jgi:thermostable 8-oxoguanine DNA glycosylase